MQKCKNAKMQKCKKVERKKRKPKISIGKDALPFSLLSPFLSVYNSSLSPSLLTLLFFFSFPFPSLFFLSDVFFSFSRLFLPKGRQRNKKIWFKRKKQKSLLGNMGKLLNWSIRRTGFPYQ
jgi:hypothetical protein